MPDTSIFLSPAPYHILSYGTILGSQVFQSFVGGIVAYKALPRSAFSQLQQAIFPIYFSMQTALPAILALTFPAERTAIGTNPMSIYGVLHPTNRVHVLIPITTMFLTGLANLVYVGPATTKIMRDRKHQETRDGKKSYDKGPHSQEMQNLNDTFATMHGISSLTNMAGCMAAVWYGFYLADRLM